MDDWDRRFRRFKFKVQVNRGMRAFARLGVSARKAATALAEWAEILPSMKNLVKENGGGDDRGRADRKRAEKAD